MIKNYIIKYSIEFVVIILGITVSFWLNEFSINSQNENERVKVLAGLQAEINEIRNYCTQRKATWKIDMNIMDIFLSQQADESKKLEISKLTTSKNRIETILVLYRVFDPPLNRYYSIINSGDLRFVKSDKVKENLSRLHNTSFSYLKTAVDHEKQLKQSFIPFLTSNHPEVVLAKKSNNLSLERYVDILSSSINSDKKLQSKLILLRGYLENKISILDLYMLNLEDLEFEINSALES
tara:strand:+ start:3932 stop:4645 length:714 start_codon:yes stop_codon:yes gene_type:complete